MKYKPLACTTFLVAIMAAQTAMSEELFQTGVKVSNISVTVQRDPNAPSYQQYITNLGGLGMASAYQQETSFSSGATTYYDSQNFRFTVDGQTERLSITSLAGSAVKP